MVRLASMVLILRSTGPTLSWQRALFHERYNSNVVKHRSQQVLLLHLGATVSYELSCLSGLQTSAFVIFPQL